MKDCETSEECKRRIFNRAFRSGNEDVNNNPEYRRLFEHFHGPILDIGYE
jgi:hypothetical protein